MQSAGRKKKKKERKSSPTPVIRGVFLPSDVYTSTRIQGTPQELSAGRTPLTLCRQHPPTTTTGILSSPQRFYRPPTRRSAAAATPSRPRRTPWGRGGTRGKVPPLPSRPQGAEPPPGPCCERGSPTAPPAHPLRPLNGTPGTDPSLRFRFPAGGAAHARSGRAGPR